MVLGRFNEKMCWVGSRFNLHISWTYLVTISQLNMCRFRGSPSKFVGFDGIVLDETDPFSISTHDLISLIK